MSSNEQLMVKYLCNELVKRKLINAETVNVVYQKVSTSKGQETYYKKTV